MDRNFMLEVEPSIEYLELFAVVATAIAWLHSFKDRRVILFCDNMSVVHMINKSSSTCRNCMVLLRILVLFSLQKNVHVFARYVPTKSNGLADALSRLKLPKFFDLAQKWGLQVDMEPTPVLDRMWLMNKLWLF